MDATKLFDVISADIEQGKKLRGFVLVAEYEDGNRILADGEISLHGLVALRNVIEKLTGDYALRVISGLANGELKL